MPVWIDERTVAERWGVSIYSVQRERKRGKLKAKLLGGRLEVPGRLAARIRIRGDAMSGQFRIGKWFLDKRSNSPNWCVCWFDPATRQTRRSSLGTEDFQVAKVRLAEHVTKNETMKNVDPDGVPLEVILIRYWEEHGSGISSAEQARYALAKWSDHFSGATVSELIPERLEMFIADLRANDYEPSYISRILSVGRAALKRAYKRGELTSMPFIADVKRDLDREALRFRELDIDEVLRLLTEAAQVPHLLRFCMISLNTLARPDAVLDLGPAQVDTKRRLIKLNPDGREQTKKYRPVISISETLLPWLLHCDGPRYVLYPGKPVASIKKSFAKAVADAGLRNVSPYCLRHTMGTELRARGVPEWEAKVSWATRARRLGPLNDTRGSVPITWAKPREPLMPISPI